MSVAGARREAGFTMPMVMVLIAVMMVGLTAAVPSWRYVMKNDKEEELLFRGGQIADAIERYKKDAPKTGGTLPTSIDQLVKGKYLRKHYMDPLTGGEFDLVRQGQTDCGSMGGPGGTGGTQGGPPPVPTPTPTSSFSVGGTGRVVGPFIGVRTRSKEPSLRVFNGQTAYDKWCFIAGRPRVVGKELHPPGVPGAAGTGGQTQPTPLGTTGRR